MDLWTYLKALRRWWWLVLGIPAIALIASFVLLPAAQWETEFKAMILFPNHPDYTGSAGRQDSVIIDDMATLFVSDVFLDDVHDALPADSRESLPPSEISTMLSAVRYSRAVTVTVKGESPEDVTVVAETVQTVMPEAVNAHLLVPENPPATMDVIDYVGEPVQQTTQRILTVAVITATAGVAALCLVAVIESLRLSYRAKYG
jgi:hypothetical protein